MAYSKYISNASTGAGTGFVHTISNSGNSYFAWLADSHIEVRLSTLNESVGDFSARLAAGTVDLYAPSDGYSLVGTTLSFTGLVTSSNYSFEVKRVTPKLVHVVDFQAGAPLTESSLDNSNKYALFRSQELEDRISDSMISLSSMKIAANITGDFVDTLSHQTISNKTFTNTASTFDGGNYTLPNP
jgi:hypothetical protein